MRILKSIILLAFLCLTFSRFSLPIARAAGTVGDGTPASCTRAALAAALDGGGTITFNCGGAATISIDETLNFEKWNTVIDGGSTITLQGVSGVQMLYFRTWGFDSSRTITFKNITITGASVSGEGKVANGAALLIENQSANFNTDLPIVNIENVTFSNNVSTLTATPAEPGFAYDFGGGAIYILGGVLNVTGSTFTGNRTEGGAGGAIHGLGSGISITNSTFDSNIATGLNSTDPNTGFGGALYVDGALFQGGGSIKIKGTTFQNNSGANSGGVAYINLYAGRDKQLKIDKSRFLNNVVDNGKLGWGGAISGGGTGGAVKFKITNSLFAGNTAAGAASGGDGGALGFAQAANVTIANSTFTGNRAEVNCADTCFSGRGGAMYFGSGTFNIVNSTIANNEAGWFAGAILGENGTLQNTLIANNTALNHGSPSDSQCQKTLQGANNLMFPSSATPCSASILVGDPKLGGLANDVLPLTLESPAVNAGSDTICAASPVKGKDQRGIARPQGDRCDIGAFELEGTAPGQPVLTSPANTSTGVSTAPVFEWNAASGAASYKLVVKTSSGVVAHKTKRTTSEANCTGGDTTCSYTLSGTALGANAIYTWSVKAANPFGKTKSAVFTLSTGAGTRQNDTAPVLAPLPSSPNGRGS